MSFNSASSNDNLSSFSFSPLLIVLPWVFLFFGEAELPVWPSASKLNREQHQEIQLEPLFIRWDNKRPFTEVNPQNLITQIVEYLW